MKETDLQRRKRRNRINEKAILKLFFRTELRPGEHIIDNKDGTIAEELGLKCIFVERFLQRHFREVLERKLLLDIEIIDLETIKN